MQVKKEHFSITGSADKLMMADLHWPGAAKSAPLVIYAHGINGFKDWGGMNLIARKFAEEGFAFLKFNFSHNGTTPANPEDFEDLEAYGHDNYSIRQNDLTLMVDFACATNRFEFDIENIVLLGHSRGGTDAILFAAKDQRINNLITWAAVSEARTPWRNWDSEKMKAWKEEGVQYLRNGRTDQELPVYYQLYEDYRQHKKDLNVENAARQIDIPWLIVHGEDDESVFVKEAYHLKSWQAEAEVAIIRNAGHTFGRSHPWKQKELPQASKDVVQSCLAFLKPDP